MAWRTICWGWQVHVIPLEDLIVHVLMCQCLCRPQIEEGPRSTLVVHRAADGREFFEPDPRTMLEAPSA